ncbi:MAG TPA: nucleotidyltransferase family protein [Burkholderiaceae bacterium]|nr:nucleotidyltransferase family protein [Burkholderiaceae bacterium]
MQEDIPPPAQALILAAGRGERMRPLTDTCPKPLLSVRGQALMQYPLDALAQAGFTPVMTNTAWLGEQIEAAFGERLIYSHEGRDFGGALETAGGIARALPQLDEVFWVVAGDVFAPDFVFESEALLRFRADDALAHLWLVPNPAHNPKGDFGLAADGHAVNGDGPDGTRLTYSTIGLYRRALFQAPWCDIPPGNPQGVKLALAPLLRRAMDAGHVTASVYIGTWADVGTPERLQALNADIPTP